MRCNDLFIQCLWRNAYRQSKRLPCVKRGGQVVNPPVRFADSPLCTRGPLCVAIHANSCYNTPRKRGICMHKILFVCHGNICRSPMAEFVMKDLVQKAGLQDGFYIDSAAVSREELGNPIYPPAQRELTKHGIVGASHRARQITSADLQEFDQQQRPLFAPSVSGTRQFSALFALRCCRSLVLRRLFPDLAGH